MLWIFFLTYLPWMETLHVKFCAYGWWCVMDIRPKAPQTLIFHYVKSLIRRKSIIFAIYIFSLMLKCLLRDLVCTHTYSTCKFLLG